MAEPIEPSPWYGEAARALKSVDIMARGTCIPPMTDSRREGLIWQAPCHAWACPEVALSQVATQAHLMPAAAA